MPLKNAYLKAKSHSGPPSHFQTVFSQLSFNCGPSREFFFYHIIPLIGVLYGEYIGSFEIGTGTKSVCVLGLISNKERMDHWSRGSLISACFYSKFYCVESTNEEVWQFKKAAKSKQRLIDSFDPMQNNRLNWMNWILMDKIPHMVMVLLT